MTAPLSLNDLNTNIAFMDGMTLAEIIWMNGHEQDAPLHAVTAAFTAFERDRSETTRNALEAELVLWRASTDYPFGKYLVP